MKISQMTTDKAADVLIRIAEPASSIMHDEKVYEMLEKLAKGNSDSAVKFFADNISMVVTVLLKDHRSDVFEVVAAMNDKTVEEVAGQPITQTIKDIKECWDGDLTDFFASLK